jgi:hypothetical protein
MWKHWAARVSTPYEPFRNFETAQWFWNHLQEKFPAAVSAMLMPNHLHLLLPFKSTTSEAQERTIITGLMGSLNKKVKMPGFWQPLSAPMQTPDSQYLSRTVRYIALNPCRRSLCADPLEWPCSTYRDLFGSTVNPWISSRKLAQILGDKENGFEKRFHKYVSSDPSVLITGTPPPNKAATPKTFAEEGIVEILKAASAALRSPLTDIRRSSDLRDLFIHLAYQQGWRKTAVLAEMCKVTPRTIQIIISKTPPQGLDAAARCLGDHRLRALPRCLAYNDFSPTTPRPKVTKFPQNAF